MYEYMKGIITFVSPYYIVLEVNQVGYKIAVANPFKYSSYFQKEVLVYLHQVVREDTQLLYGFGSLEEKELFLKLISVSGIGPKSGLAIMASDDHGGLVYAIETNDDAYLTKFPGVGKKTARQIVLDLQGKLDGLEMSPDAVAAAGKQETLFNQSTQSTLNEALEALRALGYTERELKRITKELEKEVLATTDDYLRQGLKLLMKK
ncbi:Holliday junction branch migration protein RuvA [Vagococcus silagei]|uniref:Holliday junction branch migration complex subunit RuvA n=1 Tax=Vagococcus silagei TaxID=2508885 RepID=A0A4S3B0J5_9ENTE|nr:Holliday junction branch migration protein RuvA [Vagococcus silagei]THB60531.1 Holliday junction branch migration protein RuvA [Vagococcus silagei]